MNIFAIFFIHIFIYTPTIKHNVDYISINDLIFLTHSELPWVEAREGLAPFQSSQNPISQNTMYYYYKARHERNKSK